ncbi:small-conductance calcium-activated potassium channel protein (macronuclear) [Tetrahymena thermophila SB210]|uniref:Small-conductance calcium-activated potassium channel protein n=1 Tax=Tetrahymena thermophila (strain SB210) TaxID=312017 RepID=I7MD84_TETTS|nr:small-conductance calcium-activated potassium channel protein [Tetrahymena thermophila SB210]EAR85675.3 small-conductance calcium-activated potassium channel protein [Tetrahymena thermophila SB210]|eukprot:XP_001033338.3 small-conductance calcium-activated potassium channel protein [Tetrahymena thermophila SB210]
MKEENDQQINCEGDNKATFEKQETAKKSEFKSILKQDTNKKSEYRSEFWKKSDFLDFKKNLNKMLLDEETVEKIEDARETKFYFEKMRQLDLCRLTLMVQAQAVAILDYEIEFQDKNQYYANWFLYIILICSIILIIMTYFSYEAKNQFIIATKQAGKQTTIFNSGQWKLMLLEMLVFVVFPQPWFSDIKLYFFVDYYQIQVYHYLNEILLLFMLFRFFVMAKIVLMNTQWYSEKVNRICYLYATKMSPLFILKVYMQTNPMQVYWFCYIFSLFFYSYAMRICERPLIRDPPAEGGPNIPHFDQIAVPIWCIMITIPTVGYGDTFPVTNHGRFFSAMAAISGTFITSIMVNSLINILLINFLEAKSFYILSKLSVLQKLRLAASQMFLYINKKRKLTKENKKTGSISANLRNSIQNYKKAYREYKSIIDQSNLSEQLDRYFTYTQEEISILQEQMKTAQQTQQLISNVINSVNQSASKFPTNQAAGQFQVSQKEINRKTNPNFQSLYFTTDMFDTGINDKPYGFNYNMVNHINPNQYY